MHDPIEGQFTVVGEKPAYEPAVKSWSGLAWFVGLTCLAIFVKYLFIVSETGDRLRSSARDASGTTTAEQPATGAALHHELPQGAFIDNGPA